VRKKRTETNKKALIAFGKPSAVFMTRCRVNHNEFSDGAGDARGYYMSSLGFRLRISRVG
jgi:hypothetical protein